MLLRMTGGFGGIIGIGQEFVEGRIRVTLDEEQDDSCQEDSGQDDLGQDD